MARAGGTWPGPCFTKSPKPGIWRGIFCVSALSSLSGMDHKLPESIGRQKASEPERDGVVPIEGRSEQGDWLKGRYVTDEVTREVTRGGLL